MCLCIAAMFCFVPVLSPSPLSPCWAIAQVATECGRIGTGRCEVWGLGGLKALLGTLRCISLVHVWEGCPCTRTYRMQMYAELLCVWSEFRKQWFGERILQEMLFFQHGPLNCDLGGREEWEWGGGSLRFASCSVLGKLQPRPTYSPMNQPPFFPSVIGALAALQLWCTAETLFLG